MTAKCVVRYASCTKKRIGYVPGHSTQPKETCYVRKNATSVPPTLASSFGVASLLAAIAGPLDGRRPPFRCVRTLLVIYNT